MSKNDCPVHADNFKRSAAKAKRGFGKTVIENLGISHEEWSQRFDPLFKVKGKERHKKSIERVYV